MQSFKCDVLIVGAGPAGATAALLAYEKGLNVILIDRAIFPRDKICGDQIIFNCLKILMDVGVDLAPLKNESLESSYMKYITNDFEISYDLKDTPFVSISCTRKLFDNFMFNEAKKRIGNTFENIKDLTINIQSSNLYLTKFWVDNNEIEINSKYIIGADGGTSYIRRHFFREFKHDIAIATRSYEDYSGMEKSMQCYYFKEIENGGYFWIFPISKNQANCGVIVFNDHWKNYFSTIQELHCHYASKFNYQISNKNLINTWLLPLTVSKQEFHSNNIVLVGDAAGLINPIFGHGIDAAIISSKMAIDRIVANHFQNMDLKEYSDDINNVFISKQIQHKVFRDTKMKLDLNFKMNLEKYFEDIENITFSFSI